MEEACFKRKNYGSKWYIPTKHWNKISRPLATNIAGIGNLTLKEAYKLSTNSTIVNLMNIPGINKEVASDSDGDEETKDQKRQEEADKKRRDKEEI